MKIFTAVSTHWDREWYLPFQGFRYKLVDVTNNIMNALESGKLDRFYFDGQTVVLEDYLEIRPDDRERMKKLISEGKLVVGPWYIMPDEILVSGESLVRNFLEGKREAEKFGAQTWKYGYMNDIFGHVSQMAQILNGFGIKCAYLGRGIGANDKDFKNFVWKSPDGSECFGYKQTYAAIGRGFPKAENKLEFLEKHMKDHDDGTECVVFLFTDDHGDINEHTFEYLENLQKMGEKHELISGPENMAEHLAALKEKLPVVEGELIETSEGKSMRVVTHSISSYYPLKYENDMCEQLLENKTAPALAIAKMRSFEMDSAFFRLAYRYLLKNQPHDSICGCSTDTVHEDMKYRYSQVKSISDAILMDFESRLSKNAAGDFCVSVINYSAKKHTGTFVTELKLPLNWAKQLYDNAGYQKRAGFRIIDGDGNNVPYQILSINRRFIDPTSQTPVTVEKYRLAVYGKLCAMGETVYKIVPEKPHVETKPYSDSELCAENEFISVEITPDGSVNLTNKADGRVYKNLNTFTDDGELGNGWFSERPFSDNTAVSSVGARTTVETVRKDELVTTFRITKYMDIPEYCDYEKFERSENRTELKIVSEVTLKKGKNALEFETVVDNKARDHRLRLNFPTRICGDSYYASQAFDMVKRHRGVTEKGVNFSEPEPYEKNTSGIVCLMEKDAKGGLSFVSKAGIHECAVSENGVISATMFRSFGRIMFGNIPTEKAQLEGKLVFKYLVTPETDFVKLYDMKNELSEVFSNVKTSAENKSGSALEVEGNVCVGTVKPSEDGKGVVLRLFNPKDESADCRICIYSDVKRAVSTTLAEEEKHALEIKDGVITLDIAPHKIETVYLEV